MKSIAIEPMVLADLEPVIEKLPTQGRLALSSQGLVYLDIDDGYIHEVWPLLKQSSIQKPDYFDARTDFMGAHVSVFYPDENVILRQSDLDKVHDFEIKGACWAVVFDKRYYVLLVEAPSLLGLRLSYGKKPQLTFKSFLIDFHITFGTTHV